ncbi:MAG: NAD(P)/FAD-dependent oxidoreductase [Acidobacteria bacterium]|nr:NAD(P)/FAD-dependent oxidoreductase [Acidobacteriota bacterium]
MGAVRPARIVVLGGGFGGIWTARHLERRCARRAGVEIVLVCRDNFFLMTPLLFEAFSGTLELRHCSLPVRDFLRRARFVEATVQAVDLERRAVVVAPAEGAVQELEYDQLVLALGAHTNLGLIPGSASAFTFKTLADAMLLRNHVIERFERADVEPDPERKRRLLSFVVVGGGLVGVELFGELTAFADEIVRYYPRVRRDEVRCHLLQATERILPEVDAAFARYAARVIGGRPGAAIRVDAPVRAIEPGKVHLDGETLEAATIVVAPGIAPHPLTAELPLARDRQGHLLVDAAMRCLDRPEVWALGDCARIPDPAGNPYPYLAQHAIREARQLARNIAAAMDGRPPRPFVYETLGIMASLGHARGLGSVLGVPLRGFLAWWARRTYYLFQMPRFSRRVRIVADWTLALFFRPDIVKFDLASERAQLERDRASGAARAAGANGVARFS